MSDPQDTPASAMQEATYPSLFGRRVLITGGAQGIGAAFVAQFVRQFARVAILDIDIDAAHALAESLALEGMPRPLCFACDLTDVGHLQEQTALAIQVLGGLDVLINNAGNDLRHSTETMTPEEWDRLMAVNLRHQFFVTQSALTALKASPSASVILMSSIAWLIPSTGLPAYVAAKAAIVGLTKTLARELGPDNIRVNAILPGAILTEKQQRLWLTPEYSAEVLRSQSLKRHLVPEEVARLALFLAASDSAAITGQSHIIDGGWV